jgi:hypothetical protein
MYSPSSNAVKSDIEAALARRATTNAQKIRVDVKGSDVMETENLPCFEFNTHVNAAHAIRLLRQSGFDTKKLFLVGKYEASLRVDKFILIVRGNDKERADARSVLTNSKAQVPV